MKLQTERASFGTETTRKKTLKNMGVELQERLNMMTKN
jgi:hypothetical protein